jgi:putative tricarboxylic transport membrane protein
MMEHLLILLAGTGFGFLFGLIPIAGATTALITIYTFIDWFRADPYLLVTFTTAVVVSCSIGDLFSSITMNIPGGGGSAASMVDGFPMAKKGEAARALSASVLTSCLNGLIWGSLVFLFLPMYGPLVMKFGIPEMLAFVILAFTCVAFINSEYWFRGIIALGLGIFVGMIGMDPVTGAERYTLGWEYIKAGIQILPIMAGIQAMPELIEAYRIKSFEVMAVSGKIMAQIRQGARDSVTYLRDGLRGGFIGAAIGLLPGVGGAIVDWAAYGATVAANRGKDSIPFGEGNPRGLVGCEGANMAQKSTAYVPTILFGIPAAPFEVIVMSLFMIVGLELGTPQLLQDMKFFNTLSFSYMGALLLTFFISLVFIRYAVLITKIPFKVYFWLLVAIITWSCAQYTGYWEDYAMLAICTVIGVSFKYLKLSRAAFVIGFVLSPRFNSILTQYSSLYEPIDIVFRPISASLLVAALGLAIYGIFFNKTRISYI